MESSPQSQTNHKESHVLHPPKLVEEDATIQQLERVRTEPVLHVRKGILRPGTRRKILDRVKAVAMAGLVGVAGAMAPDNAEAGGIKGLEQAGKTIAVGMANNTFLSKTPFGIVLDNQGNPVVVAKSPGQQASQKPSMRQPGIEAHAQAMGLSIIEQGMVFAIVSNNHPNESPVSITKYYNPTHYTDSIKLEKAPNGGLLLSTVYIKDGQPRSHMAVINVDQTGKIVSTIMGNQ